MAQPLAYRMRPQNLDDIVGQQHIIGKETALYKMIMRGHIPSMLLYGEPGIGKTSIANAIAGSSLLPFFALNATQAGKKDIEEIVSEARFTGQVLLFLDEIHRFNKLQQDTLLPHVENGQIILIGATTENPFHDVNPAIRSRCGEIKKLQRLTITDIEILLHKALADEKRGLGKENFSINEAQIEKIANASAGDARKALTLLESIFFASDEVDGKTIANDEVVNHLAQRMGVFGDKQGSHFYDLLSALQKSVRGSDTNAALYYLALLLENGDLVAVNRRLLVMAYEDVGLANQKMGEQVLAAVQAAERLGLPEARIPLANAVIAMTLSEKSNAAYLALDAASAAIKNDEVGEIPLHLRDSHYQGAAELGHVGYKYPHDTPIGTFGGWVNQQYLPDELQHKEFYQPVLAGEEQRLAKIYNNLKSFKEQS